MVDARGLREGVGWAEVLDAARPALPGVRLEALIDPARALLPAELAARFDAVHANAYRAGVPDCFVRLRPGPDPLFAARPMLAAPSVAIEPVWLADPLRQATAEYWLRRSVLTDRARIWGSVRRAMRPPRPNPAEVVFSVDPGPNGFGPDAPLTALLSPRFGRVVFSLRGRPEETGLLRALLRYGGDLALTGTSLLLAYAADRACAVASEELGRAVPATEVDQWRAGIARPGALLLGEAVAAARDVSVPSAFLAEEILQRHGRVATVVPIAAPGVQRGPEGTVAAHAAGLWAEACVWALAMLRWWGYAPAMRLEAPPAEGPRLLALAERLGVAGQLGFGAGAAAVVAVLTMRGEGASALPLVAALPTCRCIATQTLAETTDHPAGLAMLPDQASPPLLAAALRDALSA